MEYVEGMPVYGANEVLDAIEGSSTAELALMVRLGYIKKTDVGKCAACPYYGSMCRWTPGSGQCADFAEFALSVLLRRVETQLCSKEEIEAARGAGKRRIEEIGELAVQSMEMDLEAAEMFKKELEPAIEESNRIMDAYAKEQVEALMAQIKLNKEALGAGVGDGGKQAPEGAPEGAPEKTSEEG